MSQLPSHALGAPLMARGRGSLRTKAVLTPRAPRDQLARRPRPTVLPPRRQAGLRQALLTMLYRSTDGLSRAGASGQYLAHSAAFHSAEKSHRQSPGPNT